PIAMVGSGCRFPGGASSPYALWKLLQNPPDVAQDIPTDRFDTTGYYHPNGSHHGTTNRLLLETVYEAMESGGHTLEKLRGSDSKVEVQLPEEGTPANIKRGQAAVYVGTMGVDYNDTLLRDLNSIPTYFATGTNRAILANRVSHFFDWHGPSMSIDTACSSSLIAVHQGVQALRTGESRVAMACGTQALSRPSKLEMLSPTGRSRMWDANADGYASGEGVAAIVMKRLCDAIADGDHIECLIRETGANQDGFSNGLTVPSSNAQTALIRQTHGRAGLDPDNPCDRPQFFEAHGTGTKAGDPKEAAAISKCFPQKGENDTPLYVGSVKTVIGHTEGAAGLAGLLKGSEIIQNGLIPPNLLFNSLNPDIEPYYKGLHVPTTLTPWPKLPEGVPRRVSVNSFGFGGSNAHAILEEYREIPGNATVVSLKSYADPPNAPFTPFVFSAAYSEFLKTHNGINASNLAWTLQSRRSQLPIKASFSAATIEQLASKIDDQLAGVKQTPSKTIGIRSSPKPVIPRILGVFTGQGAQWAAMGAQLIRSSDFVRRRVQDLEGFLATLPSSSRPQWNLQDEMLASADISRIAEAELSQPLCTAIQIVLVDLLQTAGITFTAVVGYSSGEIGAAYAAGFLSDRDAIRVAYYRGLYARLVGSGSGQKGAMLAVGTDWEDAQELIKLRAFRGQIAIAAKNSSASVTLSGDADAIVHAKKVFDEEKKFARLLKVDTAYHSHHMLPCGDPYINALRACGVQVDRERSSTTSCSWFSSVFPDVKAMEAGEALHNVYWRDNMTDAVLFSDAVKNAVASDPQLTLALEVGPHPALQGPATQNISDVRSAALPYCGVLSRGKGDVQVFADYLGFIWTHLGGQSVDFGSYGKAMLSTPTGSAQQPTLMVGLPSHQWNHGRTHWHESRISRKVRGRKQAFHELLGVQSPDSTARELRWINILKVSEIRWLRGHQLQGQTVFPAAGYVAMAVEAARTLAADRSVELFELHNLTIPRAITFEEDVNSGVEILITLTAITAHNLHDQTSTADFSCYSCASTGVDQEMELMASGSVKVVFGAPSVAALASTLLDVSNMSSIDTNRFYASLGKLGYGYYDNFRGMSSLKRRLNQSSVLEGTYPYTDDDLAVYVVHPTLLDVAFQASMLGYSAPGDERLWSLHVPTSIGRIRVNPELCLSLPTSDSQVPVCAILADTKEFYASIDLFSEDGQQGMVQVEDLTIKPFAPATKADDRRLFSHTLFDVAAPMELQLCATSVPPRMRSIGPASAKECAITISANGSRRSRMTSGQATWSKDTPEGIHSLINSYPDNVGVKLISAVGENIPAAVRGETTILEHMLPDNMLDDLYKKGLGFARYNSFLASMMKQMAHRYPHAKILEIGAGTGGATKSVLGSMGNTMSSYTYTDVSVGFFKDAAQLFKAYSDKMTFKVLDVEKVPTSQGYEAHSYDIVIASNVLHATASMQRTLENTRQLLKPGGCLLLLEVTNNGPVRISNIMGGLPGWWAGVDDGRRYAPTITPGEWHTALRKAGFAGVDAITPEIDTLAWPFSIMAAQAVDDRVQFLRRPLVSSSSSSAISLESLVILGNESLESSRIAEEVEEYLGRFCGQITILNGLPTEDEALTLNPMSTSINLVDLDYPIFKQMTVDKMEGLKRLFELAKHILWITQGAQADEPYHQASIAFSRAMSHEAGHISLNHLDVSDLDHNVSKVIAEYLLRQCALDEWEAPKESPQHKQLLWSREPEAFVDQGKLKIPRLVDSVDQNARLNSNRRVINKTVPITESNISISLSADTPPALVEQLLSVGPKDDQSLVRIESSSLAAIHVAADTFLFLGIGNDKTTKDGAAVLCTANACETTPVASVAADAIESADILLIAVASELLATSMIQTVSSGSSILVHALSRRASANAVRVTFTCDAESNDEARDPSWIQLNARSPKHVALPAGYKGIDLCGLFQNSSLLPLSCDRGSLTSRLEDAVGSAKKITMAMAVEHIQDLVFPLDQIYDLSLLNYTTSAVHWPLSGDVTVEVRPLDARRLFASDKTYFLCWSHRRDRAINFPKINDAWLESFKGTGAYVKVFALDITDKQNLERVVDKIKATCPLVAGVVNGAMVLHDTLFSRMSLGMMQKVLEPKIDGSNNLDEVFYDDNLDFFIMLSSLSSVIGNSGQANYTAANGYLNSLPMQRRKCGLAASTVNIGRVAGIGYVETAGQVVMNQRTRFGLMPISEPEFHQILAETIRAGYLDPSDKEGILDAVVTTGNPTIRDDEDIQGPWFDNLRFSHCIVKIKSAESGSEQQNKKTLLPVGEQLSWVATMEQALKILIGIYCHQFSPQIHIREIDANKHYAECLSAKLGIILQISEPDINHDRPLVELGVDSLVAVEVRSWFLKELRVDIPLLKVVGGASPAELCQQALNKLPEEILAKIGGEQQTEPSKPAATPSKPESLSLSKPRGADSASTSDYDLTAASEASSPGHSTPATSRHASSKTVSSENLVDLAKPSNQIPPPVAAAAPTRLAESAKPNITLPPPPNKAAAQQQPARKFLKSEPIAFGQSRFWFLRLLLDDKTTFNVALYYHIASNLRIADMERALRVVTTRHEALRTCFVEHPTEADMAYQKVMSSSPLRLEHKKIQSVKDVADEYAKLQAHVFDIET
ncbi:MAG: hypothetical protein Q9177_004009, partial [Variospora cf. flavescens]